MRTSPAQSTNRPGLLALAGVVSAAVSVSAGTFGGWAWSASAMAGIFLLACLLWITEAVPLFATSLLVFGLVALVCANPGRWPWIDGGGQKTSFGEVLEAAADPVLLLFFAGFLLAQAAAKTRLDRILSRAMLRPFMATPGRLLLGVMLITAFFSMWMSNTATAALMLAVLGPVLPEESSHAGFRKALLLGVALGANLGGLATPIGTPPNLVAAGMLETIGSPVDFASWMVIGVPLALAVLLAGWLFLRLIFGTPPSLQLAVDQPERWTVRGIVVAGVFLATVALWLCDTLTGLPAPAVALLPVVLLTCGGIIRAEDLKRIEWDVLILIAGGIVLGAGMRWSGLDAILADLFARLPLRGWPLYAAAGALVILLSTFVSNTAAANLLLPVFVPLASASGQAAPVAIALALCASLAFALPVSTPPNAIVHSRGGLGPRDGILPGVLCGLLGWLLVFGSMALYGRIIGR